MLLPTVFTTAALLSSALAEHVIVEKRSAPAADWQRSAAVDGNYIIPLRIGLVQSNLHRIEEELRAVSDPSSATYGQHWAAKDIAAFFQPSKESVSAVQNWLEDAGFASHRLRLTGGNQWMTVNVTINEAEELLKTRYEMYEHKSGVLRPATDEYSVPDFVRQHVDIITPTMHFNLPQGRGEVHLGKRDTKAPSPGSKASGNGPKLAPAGFAEAYQAVAAAGELSNCVNLTTLACLETLYNYGGYVQQATKLNTLGIVEYTPNSYAPQGEPRHGEFAVTLSSALSLTILLFRLQFFEQYLPAAVGERPETHFLDGGVVTPVPTAFQVNGESDLDLEYAMGIVYPLVPILYQVGADASFNDFLNGLDESYCTYEGGDDSIYANYPGSCGTLPYSAVISTSYAYNEDDLTLAYETRQCYEYAKLGMAGTTFLFSSGDYGVAGNSGDCINGAPSGGDNEATGTTFNPSFPSTCPFVTSVGATQVKAGADLVNDPENAEEACETIIYSGGGFSNNFEMPSYQKGKLATFFKDHLPTYTAAQYNNNQSARGFPDIALNGANYAVSYSGQNGMVYGTSASSPAGAALFTLINDARLAAGKGPIGFINPAMYSEAFNEGFQDITSGGNQGCGTPGFSAVTGWDPVTGLGTPNFQKLKDLWLALP
ncbi:hypothetical protein RQP46_007366 [Phenoliferia psychrophenolica]